MWKNGPHLIGGWKFQTVHFFYWIWCQNYVPCFIHAIWISKLEWPNRRAPLWCVTNLQCPVGCQEDWNSLWGGQMSPKCKSELNMFYTWVIQIRNDCNTTDGKSFLKLMDNVIGHSLKQQKQLHLRRKLYILYQRNRRKALCSVTICHPSKKMIFTGQFFPSQGSWLCLRCETCSHEKTSHRKAPGPTMRTTTMPPRCLDVWIFRFCRWLKTPLLSQQRSQSCIFSGAWVEAEIVHGDMSARATAQNCLLSHFFHSPPSSSSWWRVN